MNEIGIKTDGATLINTGKKLPLFSSVKNEISIKTAIVSDTLKNSIPVNPNPHPKIISFSEETPRQENKLLKSIVEGAKIKGAAFGAQYMVAGAAIGLGFELAVLKFVPSTALNAPKFMGATGMLPKALVIAGTSGLIGLSLGAVKGAVDGAIVNISPSKGIAVGSLALTSALVSAPALRISKSIGMATIAFSGIAGVIYGNYMYDKVQKKEDK